VDGILGLVDEYRGHRQLKSGDVLVLALLRNGDEIPLASVRAALTYTVLLTEDDSMRIVSNRELIGVDVRRRPGRHQSGSRSTSTDT
jgi:hypothetical protein